MLTKIMSNQCKDCGEAMVLKPAGVNKQGKPYDAFMSCPNWQQHKQFGGKSSAKAQFKTSPQPQNGTIEGLNQGNGNMLILEAVQALEAKFDKRMNDFAHFLVEKLGSDKKDEVDVKSIPFN